MKMIEVGLPVISDTAHIIALTKTKSATEVLSNHLEIGAVIIGGKFQISLPRYALAAEFDVEADTFTVWPVKGHPEFLE